MDTEIIDRYAMLPRGSTVLCAVSGGADSVCLLHLLKSMEKERGITVKAAHYEHGIRGEESLRDARFVEKLCGKLGVECIIGHGNVPAYAEASGFGTEEAARQLRYAFLEETAQKLGCDRIATGHNADDNAETVLFNLTRGSGTKGLSGIPPVRGVFIRPLLGCTRREIEEYMRDNALEHVEDSSNAGDDYSRNLIRHKVVPVLKSINPAFSASVLNASELLRTDNDCLDRQAAEFAVNMEPEQGVEAATIAGFHPALSSRVVRLLSGKRNLSVRHTESIMKLTRSSGNAFADIPGMRVTLDNGRLFFGREESREIETRELPEEGELHVPEAGIVLRTKITNKDSKEINTSFKTYYLKYETIAGTVLCTARQPGDKIRPVFRACTKTLKSLFAEADMSVEERKRTPVIRDDRGILLVPGLALAERSEARDGEKVLQIDIIREN